ncbi:MAG: hypothetical protein IKG97_01480 [Lachnospiraceae bacterium]|nr:hypothetical protein [Lachnospiraceae bacterium]
MGGKEDNLSEKLARFWRTLFLTETGRPKSTVLLYSFLLSLVFLAIYALAYAFLVGAIQQFFVPGLSRMTLEEFSEYMLAHKNLAPWMNITQSVVPGVLGSVVCCLLSLAIKERAVPAGAYIWLVVFLVVVLVAMIPIARDADVYKAFLYFVLMYVPAGLLTGTIFTHHRYGTYRKEKLRKQREREEAERKEKEEA